jgi:biopolymer transport protein ExbD
MGWDIVARIRQPHTGIEATPFIGVVMTLLIVSMGITPAVVYEPRLPSARAAEPMMENRVTVGLSNQGLFYIDDVANPGPIPTRHLAVRIGEALRAHPAEERDVVYFMADRGITYRAVLDAMDAVRANGIRRVGLITELERDPVEVDL